MPFNLNRFKGELAAEGARPTLFEAQVSGGGVGQDFIFHCKAAQLPGKTIGLIEIPYFGRKIKVAGDQTFAEWTVTVINEETFNVRNAFENWMSRINTTIGNLRVDPGYKSTQAQVRQYAKTGEVIKRYNFNSIWPADISPIDVSWESNDVVEEFTVTLQYDWVETSSVLN